MIHKAVNNGVVIVILFLLVIGCANKQSNNEPNKEIDKENTSKNTDNQEIIDSTFNEIRINKVDETQIAETPHNVDVRKIYDTDNALAVHIKLEAGECLKPHITPVDVFFYILEGTPDIMVGEKTVNVTPDCLVESPKGIPHCIYNNSQEVVRVLVVKVPKPTSETVLL
jgi:mannose-6-phosphate isomerase-like protein (cupin superfamily)